MNDWNPHGKQMADESMVRFQRGALDPRGFWHETSARFGEATAFFDQMIADIRDPNRYAVWMVPVVSAKVPVR